MLQQQYNPGMQQQFHPGMQQQFHPGMQQQFNPGMQQQFENHPYALQPRSSTGGDEGSLREQFLIQERYFSFMFLYFKG